VSRGRWATFPARPSVSDAGTNSTVVVADPRRFTVRVDTGGELAVDLASWSNASFVAEIAPLFQEHVRQTGPVPIARSVQIKIRHLRRFWSFLDARGLVLHGLDDVTVTLIDAYEAWLDQNAGGRIQQRHVLAGLIGVLRCARRSWHFPAGASPAQVRGSARLVASIASLSATAGAKRTQQLFGVGY